jgi:hypothetical protein
MLLEAPPRVATLIKKDTVLDMLGIVELSSYIFPPSLNIHRFDFFHQLRPLILFKIKFKIIMYFNYNIIYYIMYFKYIFNFLIR